MAGFRGFLDRPNFRPAIDSVFRNGEQVLEDAALRATDRAGRETVTSIRQDMASARLGPLRNVIRLTTDLEKGRVFRLPGGGFSASSLIYARSRSERTVGALQAYSRGAQIAPKRGRWLWIPTKEAPARIGRKRATPAAYIAAGSPLGPLITIRAPNGAPLLAVENVGVSGRGKARTLTKKGAPRNSKRFGADRQRQLVVLFVAIPNTSRAARFDIIETAKRGQASLPGKLQSELSKGGTRNGR